MNEKLKEKGESLELDENENIKGLNEKLEGLKTQFPTMFETTSAGGEKKYKENNLPDGDKDMNNEPKSLAEALQQRYEATHNE